MVWNWWFVMAIMLPWKWSETGGLSGQLYYLENGLKPAVCHGNYITLKMVWNGGLSCQLHYLENGLKPAVCRFNYIILKMAWNWQFVVSITLSWKSSVILDLKTQSVLTDHNIHSFPPSEWACSQECAVSQERLWQILQVLRDTMFGPIPIVSVIAIHKRKKCCQI
jgi:hypothetical protein